MVDYEDLTNQQQAAVDALDRNVTLTAGAGTGKTTTLTARYLRMIEQSLADQDGAAPDGGATSTEQDLLLPENILTTTFTERAANDLESSVRTEITDRISSLDAEEFDAWRRVADDLESGYIHTLHGFCARLLREHALTIDRVDPGFETLDENESTALLHDTVGAILEEYETHDATATLARRFSRSKLRDVLTDLLEERPESIEWANRWHDASTEEYLSYVQSELHPIHPTEAAERLAQPDLVDAVETLQEIVDDPPDIDTGGQAWNRAVGVLEVLDEGFDDGVPSREKQTTIAALSSHLTTGDGDRYASYTGAKSRWGDHPTKDAFDAAITTLVETLEPEAYAVNVDMEIEASSVPLVRALATLTRLAAEEYEQRKRRQHAVDFSDLITYTLEFLRADENAYVRRQLREQFEYVMVDEFQDTDPRQWDLIKLLTASRDDAFDAENVFVVGDAKQSIYRFRNADVSVFQETAKRLEETVTDTDTASDASDTADDQLSTNFRTLPVVLETVNELFDEIFEEEGESYEAPPQRLDPSRDDPADLGSMEYLTVPVDPDLRAARFDHYKAFAEASPEHDIELEAMALAAKLTQVLSEPYQVYPEPDERDEGGADDGEESDESDKHAPVEPDSRDDDPEVEPRPIEPSDIAVLIRSRTHLKKYERAFEEAGVPYTVASGLGFYESTEITALLNLFRTLADPEDERALYATLRSPLFGLTDDTLARLKLDDDPLWEALADADADPLVDAHELLQTWRQRAGLGEDGHELVEDSWAAFLTSVLEDTGYLVSISADERSQQAMANVEKFREQLRAWSDDGVRSLTSLVTRIERRIDLGGRESEADTTDKGVQILTIHDAKGMEFPFVVVPGIDREFKDDAALGDGSVEFEQIGDQHAVGMKAPSPDDPFEMRDTIARETIREQRRAEERAEEKRVLYVACTRARDHLLLTGQHDLSSDAEELTLTNIEEPDPDAAKSWLDWVQPVLLPDAVCATLDEENATQQPCGDGTYTVSIPTPERSVEDPSDDLDTTVELSPDPPAPETEFRLSATDFASLRGGYGELQYDDETGTVHVTEAEDVSSPEDRHAEGDGQASDGTGSTSDSGPSADGVDPAVFGEMVHRLCELRPPEAQWPDLMEQTLVDEDAAVQLTPELQERVSRHAQRGIEYVDGLVEQGDVEYQYDELYVTADFPHGEISGFIDHLLVTPDAYHIVDYKTGDVAPDDVEADGAYYAEQMRAYAVALHQQDQQKSVRVSLVFTEIDTTWDVEWSPADIESAAAEIDAEITRGASGFGD